MICQIELAHEFLSSSLPHHHHLSLPLSLALCLSLFLSLLAHVTVWVLLLDVYLAIHLCLPCLLEKTRVLTQIKSTTA